MRTVAVRAIAAFLLMGIAGQLGAPAAGAGTRPAAAPHVGKFTLTFTGSGFYKSKITTVTSPECGDVTDIRKEQTHVTWAAAYAATIDFTASGFAAVTATTQATNAAKGKKSAAVSYLDKGCQPGHASCKGTSEPQPAQSSQLEIPATAAGKKAKLTAESVAGEGFVAKGFTGTWVNIAGASSCSQFFGEVPELLDGEYGLPAQMTASSRISYRKLSGLAVHGHLSFRVAPGKNAPRQSKYGCGDGCSQKFTWSGKVTVTRTS